MNVNIHHKTSELQHREILFRVRSVFNVLFNRLESFDFPGSFQITYLLGAIASNDAIQLSPKETNDAFTLRILRELYPHGHWIWDYVEVVSE